MRRAPRWIVACFLATALAACSKGQVAPPAAASAPKAALTAAAAPAASAPAAAARQIPPLPQVAQLQGKPPEDLMKIEAFASQLRSIVPQKDMACVTENLRDAPDLEPAPGGGVRTILNGSHADNFRQLYLLARPDGRITLALNCSPEATPKGIYRVFRNEPLAIAVSGEIMSWLYDNARDPGDRVIRSNANEAVDSTAADFLKTVAPGSRPPEPSAATTVAAAPAATSPAPAPQAPVPVQKQQTPQQLYVTEGATICLDIQGMFKALAMERANNPYVPKPDSCVAARSFSTRIIKEWAPPLPAGTVIVQAGDQAVIVKKTDLQMR